MTLVNLIQTVHLDYHTIEDSVLNEIRQCANLRYFLDEFHNFWFASSDFVHAFMLLGQDPTRYGVDLQDYLAPVVRHFEQRPAFRRPCDCIDLGFGTQDFRRRASENFGVAMASLFMVKALHVRWETITQIDIASRKRKKTPDFVGYSSTRGYLFEAKGTTSLQTLGKHIDAAKQQVNSIPRNGEGKLALVSYFCGEQKTFNPYMFVLDPPEDTRLPEQEESTLWHHIHVLDFLGLHSSRTAFTDYAIVHSRMKSAVKSDYDRLSRRLRAARDLVVQAMATDMEDLHDIDTPFGMFSGRDIAAISQGRKFSLFLGCRSDMVDPFSGASEDRGTAEDRLEEHEGEYLSMFSDGTLLKVRLEPEARRHVPPHRGQGGAHGITGLTCDKLGRYEYELHIGNTTAKVGFSTGGRRFSWSLSDIDGERLNSYSAQEQYVDFDTREVGQCLGHIIDYFEANRGQTEVYIVFHRLWKIFSQDQRAELARLNVESEDALRHRVEKLYEEKYRSEETFSMTHYYKMYEDFNTGNSMDEMKANVMRLLNEAAGRDA